MYRKYDLFYLNKRHEELGTWEDVAAELSVDKRTLQRYRKEAEFVTILMGMKGNSKTYNEWAKNLNMNFEKLCELIKKYGLEDKAIPTTIRDPRLETQKIIGEKQFLDYNKKLSEKCPPSIGYEDVTFEFEDRIIIVNFADWHLGNEQVNYDQWAKDVAFIANTPNVYVILNGDYTDNFTARGFRAGVYEQVLKVSEAKNLVRAAIEIMKEKVLGVILGCHDAWMFRDEGFDIANWMADHTVKGYWMGVRGVFNLKVGDAEYKLFASHKTKRFSTDNQGHGMKTEFRNLGTFDIIFAAHRHLPHVESAWIRNRWVDVVQSSSYKRSDRFIEKEGIPIAPTLLPCILLDNKKKETVLFKDLRIAVKYL